MELWHPDNKNNLTLYLGQYVKVYLQFVDITIIHCLPLISLSFTIDKICMLFVVDKIFFFFYASERDKHDFQNTLKILVSL